MRYVVEVNDLGPIKNGIIEMHPFTIFIGHNNTGKTVCAQAVRAAHRTVNSPRCRLSDFLSRDERIALDREIHAQETGTLELPDWFVEATADHVALHLDVSDTVLENNLAWVLDTDDIAGMRRVGAEQGPVVGISVRLSESGLTRIAATDQSTGGCASAISKEVRSCLSKPLALPIRTQGADGGLVLDGSLDLIVNTALRQVLPYTANAFHLQATRAADLDLPRSGSAYDTTISMTAIAKWHQVHDRCGLDSPLRPASDELLKLLGGTVEFKPGGGGSIVLKSPHGECPLHLTSSMVQHLAPLALLIDYRLGLGDLLVIEEPEAHLHPESVCALARVLARLAEVGVTVLCITHASELLHEVSNAMLRQRVEGSNSTSTVVDEADLAVYCFVSDEDHGPTMVKRVAIEPDFGIPEDEFVSVADSLNSETARLFHALELAES